MRHPMWLAVSTVAGCVSLPDETADPPGGDSDEPVVEGCFADPMTLTPGTGAEMFVELSEGDPVTIVHGPQGGWHIDIAGVAQHTSQNVSILTVITAIDQPTPTVMAGAGGSADAALIALAAYDDALCSGMFWGVRAFLDDFAPPAGSDPQEVICALEGERVEIAITVTELPAEGSTSAPDSVLSTVLATVELDARDQGYCP